jgi:hypothetical protein
MTEERYLGVVSVDSGILLLCDPAYVTADLKGAAFMAELAGESQLLHVTGHAGEGVVFPTLYGDGTYDVTAIYEDDVITGIKITLRQGS